MPPTLLPSAGHLKHDHNLGSPPNSLEQCMSCCLQDPNSCAFGSASPGAAKRLRPVRLSQGRPAEEAGLQVENRRARPPSFQVGLLTRILCTPVTGGADGRGGCHIRLVIIRTIVLVSGGGLCAACAPPVSPICIKHRVTQGRC